MHMRVADAGQAGYESQHSTQPDTADGLQADQSPADTGQSGGKCSYTYTVAVLRLLSGVCVTLNVNFCVISCSLSQTQSLKLAFSGTFKNKGLTLSDVLKLFA